MSTADLHIVNFRATDETVEQLRALAADEDRTVTSWLRHVIRQRYEARFGEAKPARAKGGR
jgi:hypothetical protein